MRKKKTKTGIAYLVGGGPGDPGLLTLKGKSVLERADVVMYDFLSPAALLDHAPDECERICVGKRGGETSVPQKEITGLLVEKVRQGKTVVRLKGGDPFVFGRGGEEALDLAKAGLPFEIVPGVTAGVGALAYAGIPATHRGKSASVAFFTGTRDPALSKKGIDWKKAAGTETLVFYMSVSKLDDLTRELIRAGRPADDRAALIEWGATPRQRTVTGRLDRIAQIGRRKKIEAPALLVVGPVVSLRNRLNWFENKPLFGQTVLVTRSRSQASELAAKLEALGARAIPCPTIRIEKERGHMRFFQKSAKRNFEKSALTPFPYDWLLLTSANGVDALHDALDRAGKDGRALAGVRIGVIGTGTERRLREIGLKADFIPKRFESKALAQQLPVKKGERVLLLQADIAPETLEEGLKKREARVERVTAYRTVTETELPEEALEALREDRVDWVTFTSSSTVRNFHAALAQHALPLPPNLRIASIGPVTSETAASLGLKPHVTAKIHTLDGLVEAIISA